MKYPSFLSCLAAVALMASSTTHAFTTNFRPTSTARCSAQLTASVQEDADAAVILEMTEEEEKAFKIATKELCGERNLPLQKVKNARDLASVNNSPVKPGKLFRMGRLGDATPEDSQLLFNDLGIKTLIDLRSPTELKDDPALMSSVFANFTDMVWQENGRRKEGCVKVLEKGEPPIKKRKKSNEKVPAVIAEEEEFCDIGCDDETSIPASKVVASGTDRPERHFVSLMNEFKYVRGTVSKIRKRDVAKAVLKAPGAVISKRVWESLKRPFIREINDGGLVMLNELLLRFGAPGIKHVLDLCAEKERHPVAFYCTAGKDRTGMIAAIILGLLGADPDDIVEDYSLSANVYAEMNDHQAMVGALSQRSLDPKTFLGAPPQVMKECLQSIEENYGSVEGYCNWIGFGPDQQKKLKEALTQ